MKKTQPDTGQGKAGSGGLSSDNGTTAFQAQPAYCTQLDREAELLHTADQEEGLLHTDKQGCRLS